MSENPLSQSRYMRDKEAQIPIRITPEFIEAATYRIEVIDRNCGYQARAKFEAARRWIKAIESDEYVWLGISGAATPVGLGGLVADALARGLIDVIVTTGANVFHDSILHAVCL